MGRPLDKKEAVLYGRFINAAYTMFERAPADPHPLPATGEIPEPYELVAWINMSDFFFWAKSPSFTGLSPGTKNKSTNSSWPFAARKVGLNGWTTRWPVSCGFARWTTWGEWSMASRRYTAH